MEGGTGSVTGRGTQGTNEARTKVGGRCYVIITGGWSDRWISHRLTQPIRVSGNEELVHHDNDDEYRQR